MIGMNYLLRMASVNCPPQETLFNRTARLQILNISLFWSKKASAAGKLHKSDWEEAPALISGDWWDECRRMTAGWLAEGCDWVTLRRMKLLIQTAGETSRAKETCVLVNSLYFTLFLQVVKLRFSDSPPSFMIHTWDVLKYRCYKAIARGQRSRQWPTCYWYCKNTESDDSFPIDVTLNRPRSAEKINPLRSDFPHRYEIKQHFSTGELPLKCAAFMHFRVTLK